jgi:hypothetical protein
MTVKLNNQTQTLSELNRDEADVIPVILQHEEQIKGLHSKIQLIEAQQPEVKTKFQLIEEQVKNEKLRIGEIENKIGRIESQSPKCEELQLIEEQEKQTLEIEGLYSKIEQIKAQITQNKTKIQLAEEQVKLEKMATVLKLSQRNLWIAVGLSLLIWPGYLYTRRWLPLLGLSAALVVILGVVNPESAPSNEASNTVLGLGVIAAAVDNGLAIRCARQQVNDWDEEE